MIPTHDILKLVENKVYLFIYYAIQAIINSKTLFLDSL